MTRFFIYLGRFAVIVFGFVCASLAASLFFHLLVAAGLGLSEQDARDVMETTLLLSVPVIATFIAYSVFFPAMAFFVLAELLGWRSWLAHALGGGAAAVVAIFLKGGMTSGTLTAGARLELLLVVGGVVGGIAYWAVAGRSSGLWLRDPGGQELPTAPER